MAFTSQQGAFHLIQYSNNISMESFNITESFLYLSEH